MSRKSRENKLRKVWRTYLTKGHQWTRQEVAWKLGIRIEDVQRLIDESGPSKVHVVERGFIRYCGCHYKRKFEGRLEPEAAEA